MNEHFSVSAIFQFDFSNQKPKSPLSIQEFPDADCDMPECESSIKISQSIRSTANLMTMTAKSLKKKIKYASFLCIFIS